MLDVFKKNIAWFCDQYSVKKTYITMQYLEKYETYFTELNSLSTVTKHELSEEHAKRIVCLKKYIAAAQLEVVKSLDIFYLVQQCNKMSDEEITEIEKRICDELRNETLDFDLLGQFVGKRVPVDEFSSEVSFIQDIEKPFIEEGEVDPFCLESDAIAASIGKGIDGIWLKLQGYISKSRLHEIKTEWQRSIELLKYTSLLKEAEHKRVSLKRSEKYLLSELMYYKLKVFFERSDTGCDISLHVYELIRDSIISDRTILAEIESILIPDRTAKLTLRQIIFYQNFIEKNGTSETKVSLRKLAWQKEVKQSNSDVNPVGFNLGLPQIIETRFKIPKRKPSRLRVDCYRCFHVGQLMMTTRPIIASCANNLKHAIGRLQKVAEFRPEQILQSLNQVSIEVIAMQELYLEQRELTKKRCGIKKPRFLFNQSNELKLSYQTKIIQAYQIPLLQLQMEIFKEISIKYSKYLLSKPARYRDPRIIQAIDGKLRFYKQILKEQHGQLQITINEHNNKLPKKYKTQYFVKMLADTTIDQLDGSYGEIQRALKSREIYLHTIQFENKRKEPRNQFQSHLSEKKEQLLKKFAEGFILTDGEFGLLAANAAEDTTKLIVERNDLHELIMKRVDEAIVWIVEKTVLEKEDYDYFIQAVDYFKSIHHIPVLTQIKKKLNTVNPTIDQVRIDVHSIIRKIGVLNVDLEYKLSQEMRDQKQSTDMAYKEFSYLLNEQEETVQRYLKLAYQQMIHLKIKKFDSNIFKQKGIAELEHYYSVQGKKQLYQEIIDKLEQAVISKLRDACFVRAQREFKILDSSGILITENVMQQLYDDCELEQVIPVFSRSCANRK